MALRFELMIENNETNIYLGIEKEHLTLLLQFTLPSF